MTEHWPQNLNTYLGNKGYTILKSELTPKQQDDIRNMLFVKPFVMGAPVNVQKMFPVYRETPKKLYVPRYFGEKLFGPPKEIKISEGDDIFLEFQGSLRDYQSPVINKYLNKVSEGGGGLLEVYCGWGKTDSALYTISQLRKKTLIVVHKEFLMNQWIERINRYFPTARIGRIQGQIVDIDNKDIVLCMLQSLSMKEYPATLFDSFGYTIIDEVHHISSEVFSCALFKLVTKYMLGLSATMDRNDGTTKVFKMFLGDVVAKEVRPKTCDVEVRGLLFKSDDNDFNSIETDFRGNIAVSKMLSKICTYNRRTEFILRVLRDMLEENPRQQIMIIASYKNILKYVYDSINHHNICSVGYYVGGMKESDLKESETKKVVLATYSMAAEGLDIKTLSTLFMITPMTNIEQAVGRILRQKHDFPAIVVDIVDPQENFVRQWNKRKTFYKKQGYRIIQKDSNNYTATSNWRVIHGTKKIDDNLDKNDTNIDTNFDSDSDDNESKKNKPIGKCLLKK
jgi:superfamily II DNA or RNA helicase